MRSTQRGFCLQYNVDTYLGITDLLEVGKNFLKARQIRAQPRESAYSHHMIVHYINFNSERLRDHGFIDYYVRRDDQQNYRLSEADYENLHPHDIEDMCLKRISFLNKKFIGQDIVDSSKIFMRSRVLVVHVDDFHGGKELSKEGKSFSAHTSISWDSDSQSMVMC